MEIRILENDAPVRFQSRAINFDEAQTKLITVTRGLENGNRIGSVDDIARIRYRTMDGSAKKEVDYVYAEGDIIFERGITTREISIQVLRDSTPELQEHFTIELFSMSDNVILSEPRILNVYIVKNGDPHGVIGFNTSHINNNTIILDEDDNVSFKSKILLSRSGGYYGNITVSWQLEGPNLAAVFKIFNGSVDFPDTVTETSIEIELLKNESPSEAGFYSLTLVSIKGGAKFEMSGDKSPLLSIIVKDSDNAYGVVDFAQTPPNIIMVGFMFFNKEINCLLLY